MDKALGKQRFQRIMERIKVDPECWDQDVYHCGTAHCVAGHAEIDAFGLVNPSVDELMRAKFKRESFATWPTARAWLGLTDRQAADLFSVHNTMEDLERIGRGIYG